MEMIGNDRDKDKDREKDKVKDKKDASDQGMDGDENWQKRARVMDLSSNP